MRSLFVLASFVLAGCVGNAPDPSTEPTAPEVKPVRASYVMFAATDCLQYHTYFTTPSEQFVTFMPEGFRLAETAPGTFDVRIEVTQCPASEDQAGSTQLWIELPVIPPADRIVANHTHLLPIEAYASTEELRSTLENASIHFVERCDCQATTLAADPLLVDDIVAQTLAGVYEMRATMAPDSGAFRDEQLARFIADDGTILAIITEHTRDATNRGAGTVAFQYVGSGGAPPVHEGIIHSVSGTTIQLEYRNPRVQQSL